MKKLKRAFTLAEVLITLAIIGVVAALTIPTLISKMSQRAAEARQKTIEARLLDGINRYSALEDGLSKPYETTYDFLVGLSKHYKMAQICRANEITNCIPYDKIYASDSDDSVDVSMLTNIGAFMSKEAANNYLPPASFITAQGTPVIMAFKKDCAWDMGKAMREIEDSGCIAYMYDESGTRLPNKLGKDWVQHGLAINGFPIAIVGGYKIMNQAFFTATNGLSYTECTVEKDKNYGISECADHSQYGGDRWAMAMKYCHDKGYRLPNVEEASAIARSLFKNSNGDHPTANFWNAKTYETDYELFSKLGIKNSNGSAVTTSYGPYLYLWTSHEFSSGGVAPCYIRTTDVSCGNSSHRAASGNIYQVLCISD